MAISAMPTGVLAASTGSSAGDVSLGEDLIQNAKTKYTEIVEGNAQTTVYLTVDEKNLVASLPTSVILSGTPDAQGKYIGKYSIKASGDMSGDKVINISPENNNVDVKQKGKINKSATINQIKTEFTTDDLKSSVQSEGTVTADKLTAGSWSGDFNFNISTQKINHFYSSLNLAAQDINQTTMGTKNTVADLETAENAVCGVYRMDDTYRIELYKDIPAQSKLVFEKNTKLNLNEHTITFAERTGISFKSSFIIENGTLNDVASSGIIVSSEENVEGFFGMNNMIINQEVPSNAENTATMVVLYNRTSYITNSTFTQFGDGNNNILLKGLQVLNKEIDSYTQVKNCNFNANTKKASQAVALPFSSNLNCEKTTFKVETNCTGVCAAIGNYDNNLQLKNSTIKCESSSQWAYGIYVDGDASALIDNTDIQITTYQMDNHKNSIGVRGVKYKTMKITNSPIVIKDFSKTGHPIGIYCSTGENHIINSDINVPVAPDNVGTGVLSSTQINSFELNNCNVFGKQWGVQTSQSAKAIIKNCNISSTDHSAYILGNADIYNTNFFIANRDKYTNLDVPYGLYCGAATENKKAIVNFYNCIIGSGEDLTKNTFNGIVAQGHYTGKNYTPAEINLYDTDIYTTQRAFTYNVGADDIPIITKFNLYGKGQIYVYNQSSKKFDIIDKETLNNEILTWKTVLKEKESTGYNVYNRGIIYGNGVGVVDETTNTLKNIRVVDDANVYDYRD